jgi:hypothetical protein
MKKGDEWWYRANNGQQVLSFDVKLPIVIDNRPSPDVWPGFCLPLHSCSSHFNRTVLILLTAICILFFCIHAMRGHSFQYG